MNRTRTVLLIALMVFLQQFTIAQSKQNAHYLQNIGLSDSLYSEILQEYRKIYVQLPANFKPDENKKYPLVFCLDGEVLLPAVNNVHSFYSGGFMPDMILVGVSNARNRTRDLTTSKITEKYGMPFKEENGEAAKFSKFIQLELIPFVEEKYPVSKFRSLIGHSYGGLFAIYTLINHPELFANYVAIDPSLDWDNQKLLKEAQEKISEKDYRGKSLFLSLGGQLHMQNPEVTIDNVMQDSSEFTLFARSNIAFSNLIKREPKNGLNFEWKFYPRDLHGTIPLPSIMDGLIFDFEWYQMENTDKFNSPETSKEDLDNIIKYRAEKLESYFKYKVPPYPEDLLNALGYMSLDMGQLEKSKMFFEFGIEFYPNSPNVYDSMADYYERNKDFVKAVLYVTKAYAISGNDYYKQRMKTLRTKIVD